MQDVLKYEVWLDKDEGSDKRSVVVSAVEFSGQVRLVSSRVFDQYQSWSDIVALVWNDMRLDGGPMPF